jgi:hypothetical protein
MFPFLSNICEEINDIYNNFSFVYDNQDLILRCYERADEVNYLNNYYGFHCEVL